MFNDLCFFFIFLFVCLISTICYFGGYWIDFWMNEWREYFPYGLSSSSLFALCRMMTFIVFLGSYDHQIFVLILDVNILFKSINMIDWLIDFGSSVGNLFRHAPNTHLYLKCDLNNNANQAIDLLIIIFTYVFLCVVYILLIQMFFFCFVLRKKD